MHISEEDLILHFYGEADRGERIDAHLAACSSCRSSFEELGQLMRIVDAQPPADPGEGFERTVWARLQPQLTAPRESWLARLFRGTPQWALAGAAAAVVLTAFLAGRFSQPSPSPTNMPTQAATRTVSDDAMTEAVLISDVGDHLDRSQMVLVELMNAEEGEAAAVQSGQERARELVAANRLYRQTATQSGEVEIGDLLDELERVLVEIANAPTGASARDLETLRTRIEARGLLFRVRVVQSEMRERERQDVFERTPVGP